jgi:5'-nucleotidase
MIGVGPDACRLRAPVVLLALLATGLTGCRSEGPIAADPSIAAAPSPPPTITLSIVGTNDLHGGVLPRDGRGGLELLAGYVKNLRAARAREGGAALLVDAGDMFQGTLESNLSEGASVIAAYNALGYTAAAVGNHDLDFGPAGPLTVPDGPGTDPRGALKARAAEAKFPLLAANLIEAATGRSVDWPNVNRSVIVDAAGIKAGIVGVMTRDALSATIAGNTRGLRVAPLVQTITDEAAALRRGGADVVIVASHAGGRCTRFDDPLNLTSCDSASSEIFDVVRRLPAGTADVVVAGHTHAGMAHEINGTIVIQAFSGGAAFGRADLVIDRATRRVLTKRPFAPRDLCARVVPGTSRCDAVAARGRALVPAEYEGAPITPDADMARVLAPAVEQARRLKATPLGVVLDTPIRRAGAESPLGNLFTDAFHDSAPGVDIAINNTRGGLRADLPAGPLTYGALYEAFPFDNSLARLEITGAQLRRVIEAQLRQSRDLLGISGLRMQAACKDGTLVVTMTRPSGEVVGDRDRIVVVTTDFLATGGDRVFTPIMPAKGFALSDDAPVARDVAADWLRRRGGHLREADLVNATEPRWQYPGTLPVRCG